MVKREFTIADGIIVQRDYLARWEKVLKPEMYMRLHKWATHQPTTLDPAKHTGYDVVRGTDLDMFVFNNLMIGNKLYVEL